MKRILIATTALAAMTATSAFALDMATTGAVEYRYTKDKANNKTQNPKLSQNKAEVKFAAQGSSNGLAYGAWVKVKSGNTSVTTKPAGSNSMTAGSLSANSVTGSKSGVKFTQDGKAVATLVKQAGGKTLGVTETAGDAARTTTISNNATTQSAMWLSGSWGKLVVGQDGSAAGNAIDGVVKAADYGSNNLEKASADQKSAERVTYTAPTFVDGLTLAYTTGFKGNVSTDKANKVKSASNWAVKYSTSVSGVSVSIAHAEGTTAENVKTTDVTLRDGQVESGNPIAGGGVKIKDGDTAYFTKTTGKARTNTVTGAKATYGNFTVGYGVFNNGKKWNQTKDTSGSNYGVKYASGAWAVGYTVQKAEDTNMYAGVYKKSSDTTAYSASYAIADGFSAYASKSSTSTKKSDGKTDKNNYTIIGAKISF